MYLMPLPFLLGSLVGLLSVALLIGGAYIVWQWYIGELATMAWLATGVGMLLWSFFGHHVVLVFYPRGNDDRHPVRLGPGRMIQGADGSQLYVEVEGDSDKPVAILTHGWALDSTAWYYIRKRLSPHYRLVFWDQPGLGRSTPPSDGRYTMARLAEDLRRVVDEFGNKPVTLVGHSIGGMMILTLCRLRPEMLREKVAGIVFMDTTHVWPLKTVIAGSLLRVLRWPVIEPLLWITVFLWPLVWLMNWQSYFNGTSHIINRLSSLSRDVTRGNSSLPRASTSRTIPPWSLKGYWQSCDGTKATHLLEFPFQPWWSPAMRIVLRCPRRGWV